MNTTTTGIIDPIIDVATVATVMASTACIFSFAIGTYVWRIVEIVRQEKRENKPVELLKNALLTLAMSRVYQPKGLFDHHNRDYKSFDGTKLPMMSGMFGGAENACFSYIQTPEQVARGPLASQPMIDKAIAIQKFIRNNLSTEKAVEELFVDYLNTITSKEEESEEHGSVSVA